MCLILLIKPLRVLQLKYNTKHMLLEALNTVLIHKFQQRKGLGVWEGLRFVIVALPGLFSYPFCHFDTITHNIAKSSALR